MTNFAYIMDLLNIFPKYFLKASFDHTLVSRWRNGKRRIMPGRHQVKTIARIFWQKDAEMDSPAIERLLKIWYPALPCETQEEKQRLLEIFLTEKGQTDPEYQKIREIRLGRLKHREGAPPAEPQGIENVRLGLLGFLDLIGAQPEPQRFYLVFTEGQYVYLSDENFGKLFMHKLMKLFEAGHRLSVSIRSDNVAADILYHHKTKLYAHLKGYITTQYYDVFKPCKEKILGIVGEKIAFKVIRDKLWDFDNTSIDIYTDRDSVEGIHKHIQEYLDISQPLMRYGFFGSPNAYLSHARICKDHPCHIITRYPHFGIMPAEEFAEAFALSEGELSLLQREYQAILLDPPFFDETARVRHIFCATAIDAALQKQRHQSHALTAMLGRKAWMPTPDLIQQLKTIQALLKTRGNYEACFLDESQFDEISLQAGVWGNETVIAWLEKDTSAASMEYPIVAGMQAFCATVWDEIPPELRTRDAARRKINRWLKK